MVFLCDYRIAIQGMYYALTQGMTNGDYGFIMYEQSPAEILQKSERPFKWFYPSWTSTIKAMGKIRDNAFRVVLVLGPSAAKSSYSNFTSELKRRMAEFGSKAYVGMIEGTRKPKNVTKVCMLYRHESAPRIYGSH